MKKIGGDRLKQAIYESTRALPKKEANPASLRSAAPSKGRGSRGRRLDGEAVFPYHSLSLRETGRGIHFSFTNFHLSMI